MRTWLKIALTLIVFGIIAAALSYIFVYNKPHPDIEKVKPAYSMNAGDLYNAYVADRKASEGKYNGQVIEVQGMLSKVETTDSTVTAVFVFSQGMFGDEGIRCSMLKKYHEEVKSLQPAEQVRIKGYCSGYNDSDVILEQSSIMK